MCNVKMIRQERGLVSIPVQKAVYCENCEEVSNSAWHRCGVCGSEAIVELLTLFGESPDPGSTPPATPLAFLREVA
jgi:hypothetical protein